MSKSNKTPPAKQAKKTDKPAPKTSLELAHQAVDVFKHIVICRKNKKPIKAWGDYMPNAKEVAAAIDEDNLIGVVPALSGHFVLDVDDGGRDAVNWIKRGVGAPIATLPSAKPRRFHMWFRADEDKPVCGNKNWSHLAADGTKYRGDYRYDAGYIICYNLPKLLAAIAKSNQPPADPGELLSESIAREEDYALQIANEKEEEAKAHAVTEEQAIESGAIKREKFEHLKNSWVERVQKKQEQDAIKVAKKRRLPQNKKEALEKMERARQGNRNNTLAQCAFLFGLRDFGTAKDLDDLRKAAKRSGLSDCEIKRTIRVCFAAGEEKRPEEERYHPGLVVPPDKNERETSETPLGFSWCFRDHWFDRVRFVSDLKQWWWRQDTGIWREGFEEVANRMEAYLRAAQDPKMKNASTRDSAMKSVRVREGMEIKSSQFDANPDIIATPSGQVFDLSTGKRTEAEDYITKTLKTEPDRGEPKMWLKFLKETFSGYCEPDAAIAALQRFCGYCLSGCIERHEFLFLLGCPGSGKSTLANAILYALGDYGIAVSGEHLAGGRREHRQWVARVNGARLAVATEIPSGSWNVAELNGLVSGDMVTANFMRCNDFQFIPQAKWIIAGNRGPSLPPGSGLFRRMRILPLNSIPPKCDLKLTFKLREEAPQILNWMIKGAIQYRRDGVIDWPSETQEAVDDYERAQDHLREWLLSQVEKCPSGSVEVGELKTRFRDAQREGKIYAGFGVPRLNADIKRLFGVRTKHERKAGGEFQTCWRGIRLVCFPNNVRFAFADKKQANGDRRQ